MKTKIRKQFGKTNHNRGFEKISGKSMTLPNDTFSIKELISKHQQGTMPPNLEREGQYSESTFDSPDFQKLNRLDIVDKKRFAEANSKLIEEFNDAINYHTEQNKIEERENTKPSAKSETTEILVSGTLGSETDASGTPQNHSVSEKKVSKK